jgi:hypothetical protein
VRNAKIEEALAEDMPTEDDVQRHADALSSTFGTLNSRRDAFAMAKASIELAIHLCKELGAEDERSVIVASFLLRECGDVAEAQRAVRRAKANVDAEVAAIKRRAAAS